MATIPSAKWIISALSGARFGRSPLLGKGSQKSPATATARRRRKKWSLTAGGWRLRPAKLTRLARQRSLLLAQVLEFDVAEDHFHGIAGVQLPGDDSLVGQFIKIVVHSGFAVQLDGDV